MTANAHQGHKSRLRKKAHNDFDSLAEHEVLELLLNFGVIRKNMNGVAHELLNKYGSFANVCDAELDSLITTKDVGEVTASLLKFIPKFAKMYNTSKTLGNCHFGSIEDTKNYFASFMRTSVKEQFYCVCLDKNMRIISVDMLSEGDVDKVFFDGSQVLQCAIRNKSMYVVLAHSHMCDEAYPSMPDRTSNRNIANLLESLGIRLLDHIIVGRKQCFSFKEANYL